MLRSKEKFSEIGLKITINWLQLFYHIIINYIFFIQEKYHNPSFFPHIFGWATGAEF